MRSVNINVFNNDYTIKTDAEEEYVREITLFLEEKVKEVTDEDLTLAIPRPFLLATLKITDDFLRMKKEFEEYKGRAEEKSRELVELLDRSITQRSSNSNMEFDENRE
jgi:cell division protein ZapA (FtsZ GTPase activity inhibitor)